MASPAITAPQSGFGARVNEWETLFNRGFSETAQDCLEPLGGGQSTDPRIAFLAACTQLRRLRYEEARHSLTHAQDILKEHPQYVQVLPNTAFAKLPEALAVLIGALGEGLMPDLSVSPVDFLQDPKRSSLHLLGAVGGGVGERIAPRPEYRARSLVEAQQNMAGAPPLPEVPSLLEPIVIRDDSIVIKDDSIVIRTEKIGDIKDDKGGKAAGRPPRDVQWERRTRQEMAKALSDKARSLEAIQSYLREGDGAAALKMAQQAVGRFPQSASIRESLARVQETLGHGDRAGRTYLAAGHLAADAGGMREGRLERCLRRAMELSGENLTALREILAAGQRAGLRPLVIDALGRLLALRPTISDPIQRQSWARQLEQLDPGNPVARSVREATDRFASVTPAAGAAEAIHEASPSLETLEQRTELESMAPLPGIQPPGPVAPMASSSIPTPSVPEARTETLQPPPAQPVVPVASGPAPPPAAPPPPVSPPRAKPGWPKSPAAPSGPPVARTKPPVPQAPQSVAPSPVARPLPQPPVKPPPPSWAQGEKTASTGWTRPPSAKPGAEVTYPCFYCGQPVPETQTTCPNCSHEQPAFLQRRVQERRKASAARQVLSRSGESSTQNRLPESPLTRGTKGAQEDEAAKLLLIAAIIITMLGWAVGSSVMCFIAFLMTVQLEKGEKKQGKTANSGLQFLKIMTIAGAVLGLWWGIP